MDEMSKSWNKALIQDEWGWFQQAGYGLYVHGRGCFDTAQNSVE
ncbi:MAG: hypothetical protein QW175_07760 [Candidatus Bathyarchaeia archaeon]